MVATVAAVAVAQHPGGGVSAAPPVTIAVVDTGVAALAAFGSRLLPGVDVLRRGAAVGDRNGHGTAVAAIAAGNDPSLGFRGGCVTCSVLPVVALADAGTGTTSDVAAGVRAAADRGARVIEVALTASTDDAVLDAAVADATNRGDVVVLAAGNDGSSDPTHDGYPAAASPEAISVAGLAGRALAPRSEPHGPGVDLAARGTLRSIAASGTVLKMTGSSAAAAYASGLVGQMLVVDPLLTPAAVQRILLASGEPAPGLDVRSGRILSARAALAAAAGR